MLVLSRKVSEKIIIDGHITLTVVELSGNRVRLGIAAPREVPILRSELSVDSLANSPSPQNEFPPQNLKQDCWNNSLLA